MSRFRVTFRPGIVADPATPLVIRFAAPRQATDVQVSIVELDSWNYTRRMRLAEDGGGFNLVGIFRGDIADRQFNVTEAPSTDNPNDWPTVTIKFHGSDTEYQLPIPEGDLTAEGCELELGLVVTGQVGRRTATFTSRSPVFVRHPDAVVDNRPVLTILSSRDGYHRAARGYWRRRADQVVRLSSAQAMLEYLTEQTELPGEGKWGQINIVCHGNEYAWFVPLMSGRGQPRQTYHTDIDDALNGETPRLNALDVDTVDDQTSIVLRGCNLGRNQNLLNMIRELFGGEATVYAPRFLQYYAFRNGGRRTTEAFQQDCFAYVSGRRPPSTSHAAMNLQARYENDFDYTVEEWEEIYSNRSWRRGRVLRMTNTLVYGDERPTGTRDDWAYELEESWTPSDQNFQQDHYWVDWGRARRMHTRRHGWVLTQTGSIYRYGVRRPWRDADGNSIVPNITNPDHYGRSPEW